MNIQLGVIYTAMVDFCLPGYTYNMQMYIPYSFKFLMDVKFIKLFSDHWISENNHVCMQKGIFKC